MVGPEGPRIASAGLERYLARPWRLALLVLLVIGIPTAIVGVTQVRETSDQIRGQAAGQTARASASIATIVDDRLAGLRNALTSATSDPDLRDAMGARDGVVLAGSLLRTRGVMGPDVSSLQAFDRNGSYLSGSPFRPELIGSRNEQQVRSIIAAGPSISGPDGDAAPAVALATPVRDRSGETAGIVVATVDLAHVGGWLAPLLPSVDDVYVIDGRGRLVLRATDPRDRTVRELGADPLVRALMSGGSIPAVANDPLVGRPAIVAGGPLAVSDWHVLTVISAERLERQVAPLATGFLVTTLLLLVLLVGSAVLLAHTSARVLDALRQEALTDPLTGLYNRRFMDEQLALFDSLAKRHGRPYSVIVFDLDGLKRVNDEFGHEAGDEVIRDFGALLKERLRDADVAIRLGGDEFVAILPETTMEEATAVFERVRVGMKERPSAPRRSLTVSAGAVTWHAGRAPDQLVQDADAMLYRAKRAGRDQVVAEPRAKVKV